MHVRYTGLPAALLFALGAGALLEGCSSQDFASGSTAITGRVIDPNGDPVSDVGVGIEYGTTSSGTPLAEPHTEDGKVILKSPYPNPVLNISQPIFMPIQVGRDTTLRADIVATVGGASEIVRTLVNGRVTQDTVLVWNGLDDQRNVFPFSSDAPNGLYHVRVTVPASGSNTVILQLPLVFNRSTLLVESLSIFNAQSDIAGEYVLDDIAVGERYTGMQTNGTVRGGEVILNTVLVALVHNNYEIKESQVSISPGDVVTLTTTLTPLALNARLATSTLP
jgi:hypothetical protein